MYWYETQEGKTEVGVPGVWVSPWLPGRTTMVRVRRVPVVRRTPQGRQGSSVKLVMKVLMFGFK